MKRVLVLEDNVTIGNLLKKLLEFHEVEVTVCENMDSAKEAFEEKKGSFDLVYVDGCIGGKVFNTAPFVQWLKEKKYSKIILAASGSHNKELMEVGATDYCEKTECWSIIPRLLNFE